MSVHPLATFHWSDQPNNNKPWSKTNRNRSIAVFQCGMSLLPTESWSHIYNCNSLNNFHANTWQWWFLDDNGLLINLMLFWKLSKHFKLEMWANAQRDGRPAEYRWRPLFNAAKFGWRSLLESCAVTLPRRETRWNLQGCPKLANGSPPLVGRSSPYYQDMWRRYCCLTSFFFDCRYMP